MYTSEPPTGFTDSELLLLSEITIYNIDFLSLTLFLFTQKLRLRRNTMYKNSNRAFFSRALHTYTPAHIGKSQSLGIWQPPPYHIISNKFQI